MARPRMYNDADEMDLAIKGYFDKLKERDIPAPPTMAGLAYALGFESRQSFYDYEKEPEFSYTIRKARLTIENVYEKNLQGTTPTGSIFALKNLGWTDKQEIEHAGKGGGPIAWTIEVVNAPKLPD